MNFYEIELIEKIKSKKKINEDDELDTDINEFNFIPNYKRNIGSK